YYAFQHAALRVLPHDVPGFRIPALVCAVLVSGLAFVVAARWRGLWFGAALAIVLNLSQPFVYLAQIARFYSMPLLMLWLALVAMRWRMLALTLVAMCASGRELPMILATAVLATLTVLSHNVTVAVFVLACLAASCAYVVGRAPAYLVVRTAVAAAISVLLYFF